MIHPLFEMEEPKKKIFDFGEEKRKGITKISQSVINKINN